MSPLDPALEEVYRKYVESFEAEKKKRRREIAKAIGSIALFAIAITVTLSIVRAYSPPKGSATHPETTTATAQAPQPNVTVGQPKVTVTKLVPAPHSGPDYIGKIFTALASIGTLLLGVAAVLQLRRTREKPVRKPIGTTARTGDQCPESGVWQVTTQPSTTAPIAQHNVMPPYRNQAVTWRLKSYALQDRS